jgi:DNA-binding response OmpR family regulator
VDGDSGFLQVLTKRLDGVGGQYRVLASPVPLDTVVAMRLNAIVIDLAALGPQAWGYLERLCSMLPGLGVVVCTGQSTVAQRVRGLRLGADDWVTKPCHPDLTRREFELIRLLAEAAGQVLQREEVYQRVWGYAMAHGDRSVDVFVRKLRQKLERSSPGWRYIHTHFGIGYRFAPESVDGIADRDREAAAAAPEPGFGDEAGTADTELVSERH